MVNTATSDLSSVSPAKDGAPFGKQPFIVKLLKDMFKQRPSLPCYRMTYDVAKVSQYISNSYSKMSLECLTKMLATLVWILSGKRSQTMSILNTNYMHIDAYSIIRFSQNDQNLDPPPPCSHLLNFGNLRSMVTAF